MKFLLFCLLLFVSTIAFSQIDSLKKVVEKYKHFNVNILKKLHSSANEVKKRGVSEVIILNRFSNYKPYGFVIWKEDNSINGIEIYREKGKFKKRSITSPLLNLSFISSFLSSDCKIVNYIDENPEYFVTHYWILYFFRETKNQREELYFTPSNLNTSQKDICISNFVELIHYVGRNSESHF